MAISIQNLITKPIVCLYLSSKFLIIEIPPYVDFPEPFTDCFAMVIVNDKDGYVDRDGHEYWTMTSAEAQELARNWKPKK